MFNYKIINTNSVIISDASYSVIPFGHRCTSAIASRFANVRNVALPFDWTKYSFPRNIKKTLENNFVHFVPHVELGEFVNKYDIELAHFNPDVVEGINSYIRRVCAFAQIMDDHTQSKYFVYINEDFLYDPTYRNSQFIENMFNEMIELEAYLKQRYPAMNYGILYFDFIEHQIPKDSRIINIVLDTPQLYDTYVGSTDELLRFYSGWVLSKIFNTKLNPSGYDCNTLFNN